MLTKAHEERLAQRRVPSRIERIDVIPFSLPLKRPTRWGAAGKRSAADHVVVRVFSSSGAVGTAEATPRPTIFGETQVSIAHVIETIFAPMLIGKDPNDRLGYWAEMDTIIWNPTARGALDIAIHDLLAQEAGMPLAEYLGGTLIPVPTSYMVALGDVEATLKEATDIRDATGITSFKIKAGEDPVKDIARVKALREAMGPEAVLFIDANQLYTPAIAARTIDKLREYDIAMVEEPLPIHMARERKRLADNVPVPLLGDDSVITLSDVHRELELGAIGVVGIKPPRTGIWRSMQILGAAEMFGLPVWVGCQGVSDIGTMGSAHFYCAGGPARIPYPADLGTFLRQAEDMLDTPIDIRGGCIHLPDVPGTGGAVSETTLKKYRTDK